MKITFPHMGNVYVVGKILLDELGAEYIVPPFNNKKALEIGTKYAPESACLPLKINLGNYIQAYEQGADTILMVGGCGPCRFGYYGALEKEILNDAGFNMDIIILEMPNGNLKEFLNRVKRLAGGFDIHKIFRAIRNTTRIAKQVDELEKLTFKIRPREIVKGSTDRIYKAFQEDMREARGYDQARKLVEDTRRELLSLEIDRSFKPLKVGIVGEIYTTIDSYTSFYLDSKLGNMGIEVERPVTISNWIIDHIIKSALHLPRDLRYVEAAAPYLGKMIGGHAQETIGNAVLFAKDGYDGVVQVYPLTCMPEIVAQSILPAISRDFDIPVLTLIIDEMTGEAGYLTRIEAFTDLLEKRRERTTIEENRVLSRS
ncbi:MAG: CoA protein activase [Clostridiales bacterium]|jgi:predicted nucleotide-binding protein (sugar kinase/HSP70/actin superfamily)|nr:CoA protein activase [Eubacteriales bacterium]MDH7565591.1 CoA protein activase [Clostridiales bacterium]